jgi:hypothetical protein
MLVPDSAVKPVTVPSHFGDERLDLRYDPHYVPLWLDTNGHMSFGCWDHQLKKVATPHEKNAEPAAVDVAPLRSHLEKGWVNEQLFVAITLRATRARCVWLCLRLQMVVIVDSHITDIGGQVEDGVYQGAPNQVE